MSSDQPSDPDGQSRDTARSTSQSDAGVYQDVLVNCNTLIKAYHKGEITKPSVYVEIQLKLAKALGSDRERTNVTFRSFIATVESHDSKMEAAVTKGRAINLVQRTPSPPVSHPDEQQSDEEPTAKRVEVDKSAYAWVVGRQHKCTVLQDTLTKILKLIETYTVDPKATKQSLVNELDCPEFPDSEWKNVIAG